MDGSEDRSKLASTLYDPNSAAAQPFLSKPFPSVEPSTSAVSDTEEGQASYAQISYNHGPRTVKDVPFLVLFCLLVLCTFGFGIFACVNSNPHRYDVSSFTYDTNSSSCTLQEFGAPFSSNSSRRKLLNASVGGSSAFLDSAPSLTATKFDLSTKSLHESSPTFHDFPSLQSHESSLLNVLIGFSSLFHPSTYLNSSESSPLISLIWTLVITLIMSGPFFLFVLWLLKHYTKQLVYASLPFFVIIPIFINVYWFVACTMSSSCNDSFPMAYRVLVLIFVFLVIGIVVWILVSNRHRIELTVDVIGVAANALSKNLGLFGILPSLTLGLFVYYVPIVVFLIYANRNGDIVSKERNSEYYCAWKQYGWVPAYYTLAILTMLWSATAMVEAQSYLISGTIAQWYFSKDYSGPKRAIRSSLRNAFGPSSGTICFSGLVVGAVRAVRSMVDNARQEEGSGIVNLILRCCVSALLSAIDFLNKFTINFAAITGEAYCSAARMTFELLKRNLLSTVFVETVSTQILAGIVLVLSALYAILVCVVLKAGFHLGDNAYFVALMAWILLVVILGFFVHVLDDAIDTVYICYAIDRDRGDVSKQDIHEVYHHLPISRSNRTGFAGRAHLV